MSSPSIPPSSLAQPTSAPAPTAPVEAPAAADVTATPTVPAEPETPASAAPSAFSQAVDADLQALANALGKDALTAFQDTINTSADSVIATPSTLNASVQAGLLLPGFIGAAPKLQSDAIVGFAQFIRKVVNAIPPPSAS